MYTKTWIVLEQIYSFRTLIHYGAIYGNMETLGYYTENYGTLLQMKSDMVLRKKPLNLFKVNLSYF